jgi:hypothetical protein
MTAAPPAPSPTPAAPAPAAPKPSAAPPKGDAMPPAPIEKEVSFDDQIDSDLAAIDESPAKRNAKASAAPVKPPEPKKEEVEEPSPDDEPAAQPEPKDEAPAKPVKAADLRTAYEGLKKKVKEDYEPKVAKLEARVKELEASGPEKMTPIVEELTQKKQRLEELENRIRHLDYQQSQEYQDKYEKPYQEAWKKAVADLDELTVVGEDGDRRKATASDLLTLANMSLGEARTLAKQMFGDSADDVMAHRRTIKELSIAQNKALEESKKNATERDKQMAAQRQIEHQQTLKLWQESNKALAEKFPKWFSKVEGDAEGNTLLDRGFSLADLHFVGEKNLTPEQIEMLPEQFKNKIKADGKLDLKDKVALDALLRHKIASHSRIALNLKKANERIKELEKTLSEYEGSELPGGKTGGTPKKASAQSPAEEALAELDAIDAKNR